MVQGSDGYWYAYIVESNEIAAADSNGALEYGVVTSSSNTSPLTFNSGIVSVYTSTTATTINVIDNAPSLSPKNSGQVGLLYSDNLWPFIQTLDLTLETIEIRLEQPGPDEVVSLKHDNDDIDDFAGIEIDRSGAHNNAHVHLTITDQALNLDPTAEDVVLFNVTAGSEGVAWEQGTVTGAASGYTAFNNGFDDNGVLKINYDANGSGTAVLTDNATADDPSADKYLVFWESAENSGIFYNTDDDDQSNLKVTSNALRGTTATIDYNDSAQSFVVQYDFATIDMDATSVGDEWNSGEEMTVVLYDQDLNLNTFKDEDLTVIGGTLVPSLQIGYTFISTCGCSNSNAGNICS